MRRVLPFVLSAAIAASVATAAGGAAPFPGVKNAKDRAAWRAILHWPSSCEQSWRSGGHPPTAGISLWRTSTPKRLVSVTCYLAAYQWTAMYYLVDAKRHVTGPMSFHIYIDPGSGKPTPRRETEILGVSGFTPRTGILDVFDKARGPGDCGIYSTFRLSVNRFVPVASRAKTACDGKPPYNPARWPKLPTLRP